MKFDRLNFSFFSRQKVGRQLGTLYIFTILLPVVLLSGIIYLFSYRQITENYTHLSELQARQVRSVFTTTTLYLQNIYDSVATNDDLRALLMTDFASLGELETALNGYTKFFEEILENNASISSLKLYADEDFFQGSPGVSYFYPLTDTEKQTGWYKRASTEPGNFWKSDVRIGQYDIPYQELTYYCRISLPRTGSFAILVMTMSNDHLRSLIDENEYDIYVSVNTDPVFLCTDRAYAGSRFPLDTADMSSRQESGRMKIRGENTIACATYITPYASDDRIYILVASSNALSHIHRVGLIFLLTVFLALAISALLIYLYTRYFSARIQTLRLAMHKVAHNDYEIVNSIQGDDELTATFTDLKSMVSTLKENQAKIYEAQIREQVLYNQQQQMELKLLTSQINPHFLYNTLETIRMKAFAEGNREVANAIKLLGKSMRYVLNNTKTTHTTLDKEIDYVRTYLAIQKLRFETKFDYKILIDEKLDPSRYQILPLLLQPIVENAVSHGLRDMQQGGHIIIKIFRTPEDRLTADVFDNGTGMTAEELDSVIRHLDIPQPESDHGVGLYNINNRVHLFYGKEYGLTIKSRPGEGTLVTLTIPLVNIMEEEE